MRDNRRYADVAFGAVQHPINQSFRFSTEQRYDSIGIEQEPHQLSALSRPSRSCSSGCSRPSLRKSSLTPRLNADRSELQPRLLSGCGRRMIALPSRETSTSSTSNRNSLGRRTACELPDLKTFATCGTMPSSDVYTSLYIRTAALDVKARQHLCQRQVNARRVSTRSTALRYSPESF